LNLLRPVFYHGKNRDVGLETTERDYQGGRGFGVLVLFFLIYARELQRIQDYDNSTRPVKIYIMASLESQFSAPKFFSCSLYQNNHAIS
jgi:hypothetical protein